MKEEIEGSIQALGIKSGKPNCGVVAVAYVAQRPVEEVTEVMKKIRGAGSRWNGATNWVDRNTAMSHYNVSAKKILDVKSQALKTWMKNEYDNTYDPEKKYMVNTTGHVQIIDKGFVIDQRGCNSINEYWGKNKRIKRIHEILN